MQSPTRARLRGPGHILRLPQKIRRFQRDDDGATVVEFALLAGPFFLLLFGIIESSLIFFASQILESAVDNVGRQIRTGQLDNSLTEDAFKEAICGEASLLLGTGCTGLRVDLQTASSFSKLSDPPVPDDGNTTDFDEYGFNEPCPAEIVMITASYEWPIFTYFVSDNIYRDVSGSEGNSAFRKILLNAIAVFRTEPYVPSSDGRSC